MKHKNLKHILNCMVLVDVQLVTLCVEHVPVNAASHVEANTRTSWFLL